MGGRVFLRFCMTRDLTELFKFGGFCRHLFAAFPPPTFGGVFLLSSFPWHDLAFSLISGRNIMCSKTLKAFLTLQKKSIQILTYVLNFVNKEKGNGNYFLHQKYPPESIRWTKHVFVLALNEILHVSCLVNFPTTWICYFNNNFGIRWSRRIFEILREL